MNQAEFLELESDCTNANTKTVNPFWYFLFNIRKLETNAKKFGGRITTNGSDVSVQLCRIKPNRMMTKADVMEEAKNRKRKINDDSDSESDDSDEDDDGDSGKNQCKPALVNALKQHHDLKHLSVCGVDLGVRNIASTVRRTWDGTVVRESNVLHKSRDYHYNAGFHRRRRKHRQLLGDFDDEYQQDLQCNGDEPSERSGDYMKYLRSRLKWFNKGTARYMQRQVCNIKFDKFRATQQQMTKMAQEIVGVKDVHNTGQQENKCNVVFIGNCSTPSNSAVKGHMRSPGNKPIVRYLKQVPNTFVDPTIDEFRSTKNCHRCYNELHNVESSKQRLKLCHNCKPADDSIVANVVTTYRRKRDIQGRMTITTLEHPKPTQVERAERVKMGRMERWTIHDKIRMETRRNIQSVQYANMSSTTKRNLWLNRDINASRNILYFGMCMYGQSFNMCISKDPAFHR